MTQIVCSSRSTKPVKLMCSTDADVQHQPLSTRQVSTAGDSMGAMRSYVKALTLQPNQQSTWDSLAIACTATGDFGLAESADHHDLAAFRRQFVF